MYDLDEAEEACNEEKNEAIDTMQNRISTTKILN